jgi:hypothetical protein
MRYKLGIQSIALVLVFISCTKQEELITIVPNKIAFVHENGTPILYNECINPNSKYAIAISTKGEGNGNFSPKNVAYSINGVPYSMSFARDGTQLFSVVLVDGINKAEITATSFNTTLNFNAHTEFEIVN